MGDTYKEVISKFNLTGATAIPIPLKDGSVYNMDKVYELKALDMKLQSEGVSLDDFKEIIKFETDKHWKNKTVPTKFDWDQTWEQDLKDKFRWEVYDKLSIEENKKKQEYFKKFGVDYGKISCSCWEKNLNKPERELKNYKIIRKDDFAVAASELNSGGLQLVLKRGGEADKFDERCTMEKFHRENEYATKKIKSFKGELFKNQAELAGIITT